MNKKFISSAAILLTLGIFTTSSIVGNATLADFISDPISDPISSPLIVIIDPTPEPTAEPTAEPTTEPTATPAPTQAPSNNNGGSNNNSGGSSNSGGGGGGNSGPSECGDAKPGIPVLLSAVKSGPNQVTLRWFKAAGSYTHYLLAYGVTPGKPIYGLPNATGPAATEFTVKGLSAGTYYFQIAAVNGCMPGDFSNELASGQVAGAKFTGPAKNFKAGAIAPKNNKVAPKQNQNTQNPNVINLPKENKNSDQGWGSKVKGFFKGIFG